MTLCQNERASQKALRHGVELPGKIFWLYQLEKKGAKIDLEQIRIIEGTRFFVLRVTLRRLYRPPIRKPEILLDRTNARQALPPSRYRPGNHTSRIALQRLQESRRRRSSLQG